MKLLRYIGRILAGFGLCWCLMQYHHLIRAELGVAHNKGKVTLVANTDQQYIEGIKLNGRYVTADQVQSNEWYSATTDVVNDFYISQYADNRIELQSPTPVHSIDFDYRVVGKDKHIQVYVDDELVGTVDTTVGKNNQNLAHIELMQERRISRENILWYVHLLLLALGALLFLFQPLTRRLSVPFLMGVALAIAAGHLLLDWGFPLLYREKVVVFASEWTLGETKSLLTCLTLLTAAGWTGVKASTNHLKALSLRLLTPALFFVSPLLALYLSEHTYSQTGNLDPFFIAGNLLILYTLFIVIALASTAKLAAIGVLILSTLAGLANKVLIDTREAPLLYHNLFQFQDGLTVASSYRMTLTNRAMVSLLFCYLAVMTLALVPRKQFRFLGRSFKPGLQKLVFYSSKLLILGLVCVFFLPGYFLRIAETNSTPLNYWKMQATYADYGLPLSLLNFYEDSLLEEPAHYSSQQVADILSPYGQQEGSSKRPNILFIQSESQADFLGLNGLTLEPDPLAFQHGLENSVQGSLNVSVYGGGTANTEYEVLTSHAIGLLSSNIIPYQQLITQERVNFTTYLADLGYQTVALHPEKATNYNRKAVYPLLGFDRAYFTTSDPAISTLTDISHDRNWVSDQSLFEGVKTLYRDKGTDPLFSFVVTMQGHGGYVTGEENYPRQVAINGSTSEFLAETEFLTSLKKSDEAFKDLIQFFKDYPEPTMIVMWGDHQPTLSQAFYDQFFQADDPAAKYTTPFVIWSNFPLPAREKTTISPNYIVPYALSLLAETDYALPRSPYYQFLSDLQQKIPVLTTWGNKTADGSPIDSLENVQLLDAYYSLEYNRAVDKNTSAK